MQPKILEDKTIVAMRGRNPDNPSDRTVGAPTEQRLEPNSQGICNTLTSVQKDNLVMEKMCISTKGKENDVASTILAGYERTNMTGFNADNGVAEIHRIGQISNDGSQYGTVIADDGISANLVAGTHRYANNCIQTKYRIRKLTPIECWRLMDFTDEDFERAAQVNSNTQLYKQAGNSIVKNVLVAILGKMMPGKEDVYKKLETR